MHQLTVLDNFKIILPKRVNTTNTPLKQTI